MLFICSLNEKRNTSLQHALCESYFWIHTHDSQDLSFLTIPKYQRSISKHLLPSTFFECPYMLLFLCCLSWFKLMFLTTFLKYFGKQVHLYNSLSSWGFFRDTVRYSPSFTLDKSGLKNLLQSFTVTHVV